MTLKSSQKYLNSMLTFYFEHIQQVDQYILEGRKKYKITGMQPVKDHSHEKFKHN